MNRLLKHGWLVFAGLLVATIHADAAPPSNPQLLFQFCAPQPPSHLCPRGDSTGSYPTSLIRGPDKAYYGVTAGGGNYPGSNLVNGLVYRIDAITRIVSVVHRFDSKLEGRNPSWLVTGTDGNLYGYLPYLGRDYAPSLYRLSLAGEFTKLYSFDPEDYPVNVTPLVTRDGNFLGTSGYGLVSVYRMTMDGAFETLHAFDGISASGVSRLTPAPDGYLYGTATINNTPAVIGMIFRIGPDGAVEALHYFPRGDATGIGRSVPYTGLTLGPDQALYGTMRTSAGEAMFRLTLDGQFTQMDAFGDPDFDTYGSLRLADSLLTLMPDHYFYGIRERRHPSVPYGLYTEIFRLSLNGDYTQLYVFPEDGSMGYRSLAPLIRGFDNALYGTTAYGGKYQNQGYGGVVFRYVPPSVPGSGSNRKH